MNKAFQPQFAVKPLAVAMAALLAAGTAAADNGMPGAGLVVRNQNFVNVNGVVLPGGDQIIGLANKATITTIAGAPNYGTVIQWGSPAVVDSANTKGFNLKAGNTLNFTCAAACGYLNIDISGAMSNVAGVITTDANTSALWIANEKGINFSGKVTAAGSTTVAIVGANLNTLAAIDAFAGGNAVPLNFVAGSPVTMSGDLSKASNVLIAGSDAVNVTGKVPAYAGQQNVFLGGVGADALPNFNGVSVGADAKGGRTTAKADLTLKIGTASAAYDLSNNSTVIWVNGDLNNQGYLDFKGDTLTGNGFAGPWFEWTGTLNNSGSMVGTAQVNVPTGQQVSFYNNGTTNPLVGGLNNSGTMSFDGGISFSGNGAVTNTGTMTTAAGNIYLQANGVGKAATNSGTITAVGGYAELHSEKGNAINTGTLIGDDVYIEANYAGASGTYLASNTGTINVTSKGGEVYVHNHGSGDVMVDGTIAATGSGNYIGYADFYGAGPLGKTTINTAITVQADRDCSTCSSIDVRGNNIVVNKSLTVVENTTGAGADGIDFWGNAGVMPATLAINANLAAGNFKVDAFGGRINVALNGNLTTTAGGYRYIEIDNALNIKGPGVLTANAVYLQAAGNINNGLGSPNSLLNGLAITTVGTDPWVGFYADGASRQAVNLKITGDAIVSSTDTVSAGALFPYIPLPNAQSSLLIQTTGNMVVGGKCGGGGVSGSCAFHFPGGVAFVAGGSLSVAGSVDNAWTGSAIPFQGQYYESGAGVITMSGPLFTNGNSWINYNVRPTGPLPTVYGVKEVPNLLGFVTLNPFLNPDASHLNSYTLLMTTAAAGGDWVSLVNSTPIH